MPTPLEKVPVAILTATDILQEAVAALQEADALRDAVRANETRLRVLCRQYDQAGGVWGFQPYHLRRECERRGML